LQGFGRTDQVASLEPIVPRFQSFGLNVVEIDGHSADALDGALAARSDQPLIVVLRTIKGKGVSFMEGRIEWHYLPLNAAQYAQALAEIEAP
jgi:transketolase